MLYSNTFSCKIFSIIETRFFKVIFLFSSHSKKCHADHKIRNNEYTLYLYMPVCFNKCIFAINSNDMFINIGVIFGININFLIFLLLSIA